MFLSGQLIYTMYNTDNHISYRLISVNIKIKTLFRCVKIVSSYHLFKQKNVFLKSVFWFTQCCQIVIT